MEEVEEVKEVEVSLEDLALYEKLIRCSATYIFNGKEYTIKNTILIG